jgi:luciferase family oxidoreductase group 1
MLPNHAPIVIAEQFGTLEALYPGRIDLGLGRAPGTDQRTVRALRRDQFQAEDTFPRDVVELQALLGPVQPNQVVRAVPGADSNVPLYILGSSLFGAQLAAYLGLPFAFAAHFAPDHLMEALAIYRAQFRPSEQLSRPHAMVGVGVFAADSDAEARRLFSSQQQQFIQLRRGTPGPLPPPVDDMESFWSPQEKINVARSLAHAIVGSPQTVGRGIEAFLALTQADELILASQIFDHGARLRSYEIVADLRERVASAAVVTA